MNQLRKNPPILLMVDDDREDIYLTKRAFCGHNDQLVFKSVKNGDELFDYLNQPDDKQDIPDVILLDINIPKQNGFALLEQLKSEAKHRHIPVCMLTTSNSPRDVNQAYALGASSFICKSPSAAGMKTIAEVFCGYWFNLVELSSNSAE